MCGNSNMPEPTARGVWWKDDTSWVQYPQDIADQILTAYRNGDTEVSLGRVKSAKYPNGVYYSVDLISMQQTNSQSGFTRSVKIISSPDNDSTVKTVPTYTIDLNTHRSSSSHEFNISLKLPNNTLPTSALMHKTGELLLEKITRKAYVEAVLKKKSKVFPGYEWKVQKINTFAYGNSDDGRYAKFLTKLLALVDSNPSTLDVLFEIVEKENTEQGGPVEYLFKEDNHYAYARNFLRLRKKAGVYLAIGNCVSTSFSGQTVTVSDSSNIVHVGDVVAVVSDNDY